MQSISISADLQSDVRCCSGGPAPEPAAGIAEDSVESEHQMIRIANGHVVGLPGRGIDLAGTEGAVVENIRVRETRLDGIATGAFARVVDCTVLDAGGRGIMTTRGSEIARNAVYQSGGDGIHTDNSTVVGNRVILSGGDGIYAESSTIVENNVQNNIGDGINGRFYSTITGNTVDGNGSVGISATVGTNVSGNTVTTNGGDGIAFATGGAYRDNLVIGNGGADGRWRYGCGRQRLWCEYELSVVRTRIAETSRRARLPCVPCDRVH